MKLILFYVLAVLPFLLNAQQIDTTWYNNKWEKTDNLKTRHYFRVTKKISNDNFFIRDFYETKAKQMEGYFSSLNPEIKNGTFLYWFRNGKIQLETTFKNNEQRQARQYDENGNIINEWELLEVYRIINGKPTKELVSIERAPKFPGGEEELNKYIIKNLTKINTDFVGQTNAQFKVNTDGSISDIKILDPLEQKLEKQIIRIIEKMPDWIPGKQNGKPVAVKMSLPIYFK